ncbi:sigma factor [Streptomyces rectiviolaceus]|uniref:sigma factor n=1 Tax=Streptomyces rectiviolaceus TaxID=332591 RepID=UPI00362C181F
MHSGRGSGTGRDAAFSAFMAARYGSLVRTARLLTGSTPRAEDLTQEALLRTYRAWHRIGREEAAEAYTRTTMVRLLIKDRRRRWTGEIPAPWLPDVPEPSHEDQVATRVAVREVLWTLPPRSVPCWSCATTTSCPSGRPPRCSAARPAL